MQSTIGSRCGRARQLFLLRRTAANKMTTISSYTNTSTSISRSFLSQNFADASPSSGSSVFTRQFSVLRRDPWDVSRKSTHVFKHLIAFVSDFSPTPLEKSGSIPKGYASFTTSSGNAAMGMKQNKKGRRKKVSLQKVTKSIMLKSLEHLQSTYG